MQLLQGLYPYALAATNVAGGWLLYDVLGTGLGAILLAVGAMIVLAVVEETVRTAASRTTAGE